MANVASFSGMSGLGDEKGEVRLTHSYRMTAGAVASRLSEDQVSVSADAAE